MDEKSIIRQYEKYCIDEFDKLKRVKSDGTIAGVAKVVGNLSDGLNILNKKYTAHIHYLLKDYDGDKQILADKLVIIARKHISELAKSLK